MFLKVMQGYALAFSKGLTKDDLDLSNTALHPTSAEVLIARVIRGFIITLPMYVYLTASPICRGASPLSCYLITLIIKPFPFVTNSE